MSSPSEKLQKLAERQRRLQIEIERVKAVESQQERKRDARRKIVVGAMVLGLVERGEWPKERLMEKLDAYLSRDYDRALFNLPARAEADPDSGKRDSERAPRAAQG